MPFDNVKSERHEHGEAPYYLATYSSAYATSGFTVIYVFLGLITRQQELAVAVEPGAQDA